MRDTVEYVGYVGAVCGIGGVCRHPLLTRAFLINGRVISGCQQNWLEVYWLALGVRGALVPCEDVEAFAGIPC